MERSIVHLNKYNENIERINTIIKECSEQSERGKLMECSEAISFKNFINKTKSNNAKGSENVIRKIQ